MADVGNVNRQATARALCSALATARAVAGLVIQTHRVYESTTRLSKGLRQDIVAQKANTTQPTISDLEQGKRIPKDAKLKAILKASGFDMRPGHGGNALFSLLSLIRNQEHNIMKIEAELPK